MVSPGMLQRPMAAIVVCVDWAQVHNYGFPPASPGPYIDVGTAAGRLAGMIEPDASAGLRPLLRDIQEGVSETAVQAGDPAGYVERLDALCRTVAEHLVRSLGLDRSP